MNTNNKPHGVVLQQEALHRNLSRSWGSLNPKMKWICWRSKAASLSDHVQPRRNIQDPNINISHSIHINYWFVGLFNSLFGHCNRGWNFSYDITSYPVPLTNIEMLDSQPGPIRLSYTNGIAGNMFATNIRAFPSLR